MASVVPAKETSSGVRTYYLLAEMSTGSAVVYDIQVTCVYIPTAYGTVEPTIIGGAGSDADDATRKPLTDAEIAAERAASIEANMARMERELAELRAQFEALNISDREEE